MENYQEEPQRFLISLELDKVTFERWNTIKTTEGVKTDRQLANILILLYESTLNQQMQLSTRCGQCSALLPSPQLCSECQQCTGDVNSTQTSQDSETIQAPVIYRLLHISPKEGNECEHLCHDPSQSVEVVKGCGESSLSPEASVDPRLTLTVDAKDFAHMGRSIIIVDYISKHEDDVHQLCSEGYIFTSVGRSDGLTDEDNVRVALDVPTCEETFHLDNSLTDSDLQLGANVIAVGHIPDVGDHWIEQLLYGEGSTQFLRPKDSETATAVAALEALSSDTPLTTSVKIKPRRGKPVPASRIRVCRLCGRQCTSPAELKRHMMLHTGEKPFVCDVCGAAFNQGGNLKKHKLESHNSSVHFCPQCGIRFVLVEDLRRHIRFHSSNERKHVCEVCNKAYANPRNLRLHKKTHASDRPWKCVECAASFPSKRKLTIHKGTHTGEKVFKCKFCEEVFLTHQEYRDHSRDEHRGAFKGEKERRRAQRAALELQTIVQF